MKKYHLFYMLAILISFSSCSNKLKNDEATDLISKLPNEIVSGKIKIWFQSSCYGAVDNAFYKENNQLIKSGILTTPQVFIKEAGMIGSPTYTIKANLTDSAQALIIERGNEPYQEKTFVVKCGELKFVEVISIFQEDNSKTAEIEYKVVFTTPTMFADVATTEPKYDMDMTYTRKKVAKKYDNGWKIEN